MNKKEVNIWRDLKPEEVLDFVNWALDNWKPNTQMNNLWHPVIKNTWGKLDAAFATNKTQILADWEESLFVHKEEK